MKTMWKRYTVTQHFTTPFASGTPKNLKDIEAMLENRMPATAPPEPVSIPELASQVAEEVGATEEIERDTEGVKIGHAVFKHDGKGLYYEARCVRAHIKDCANALQKLLDIKALKSKVAQRVYVEPAKLYLGKSEPDDCEMRIIHVMTAKGVRNSLKKIDYVKDAELTFNLKVLDDGVVTEDILRSIFEYGSTHGMGQERSQDFGRYTFEMTEVK